MTLTLKCGFTKGFKNTQHAPSNFKIFSILRLKLGNANVRFSWDTVGKCERLNLICTLNSPGWFFFFFFFLI